MFFEDFPVSVLWLNAAIAADQALHVGGRAHALVLRDSARGARHRSRKCRATATFHGSLFLSAESSYSERPTRPLRGAPTSGGPTPPHRYRYRYRGAPTITWTITITKRCLHHTYRETRIPPPVSRPGIRDARKAARSAALQTLTAPRTRDQPLPSLENPELPNVANIRPSRPPISVHQRPFGVSGYAGPGGIRNRKPETGNRGTGTRPPYRTLQILFFQPRAERTAPCAHRPRHAVGENPA